MPAIQKRYWCLGQKQSWLGWEFMNSQLHAEYIWILNLMTCLIREWMEWVQENHLLHLQTLCTGKQQSKQLVPGPRMLDILQDLHNHLGGQHCKFINKLLKAANTAFSASLEIWICNTRESIPMVNSCCMNLIPYLNPLEYNYSVPCICATCQHECVIAGVKLHHYNVRAEALSRLFDTELSRHNVRVMCGVKTKQSEKSSFHNRNECRNVIRSPKCVVR